MTADRRPALKLAIACPNYRPGAWAPSDTWMVLPPALIEFMREGSLLEEPEGRERIRVVSIRHSDCGSCQRSITVGAVRARGREYGAAVLPIPC